MWLISHVSISCNSQMVSPWYPMNSQRFPHEIPPSQDLLSLSRCFCSILSSTVSRSSKLAWRWTMVVLWVLSCWSLVNIKMCSFPKVRGPVGVITWGRPINNWSDPEWPCSLHLFFDFFLLQKKKGVDSHLPRPWFHHVSPCFTMFHPKRVGWHQVIAQADEAHDLLAGRDEMHAAVLAHLQLIGGWDSLMGKTMTNPWICFFGWPTSKAMNFGNSRGGVTHNQVFSPGCRFHWWFS